MRDMTGTSEQVVTIAAKMYEARKGLRSLFGERYDENCERWREVLRVQSAERPILDVALEMLKDMQQRGADGWAQAWVLAAAVDVIEEKE